MNETITIDLELYNKLLADSQFLNCLRNNGVDNWDWYSDACEEYNNEYPEDE